MATVNIGNNTGNSGGLQDNRLDFAQTTFNYGIHPSGLTGPYGSRILRELQRFDLSSISAGATCNSAVLYLYDKDWASRTADCTITLYKIADANGNWVEGTVNGDAETGSPCWGYKAYHATTPTGWAGSAGLSTAGTDYVDTSLGSTIFTDGVSGYRAITLNADGRAVLESWFGGTGGNGLVLIGTGLSGAWTEWQSRQGTDTQRPYLAIDYTEAGAGNPWYAYAQQ